jgi:hypothetical protein
MTASHFHGEYRAYDCPKVFVTTGQPSLLFPPRVEYTCDLCEKIHDFRFIRAFTVATPRQHKAFQEFCDELGVEQDVDITYQR